MFSKKDDRAGDGNQLLESKVTVKRLRAAVFPPHAQEHAGAALLPQFVPQTLDEQPSQAFALGPG